MSNYTTTPSHITFRTALRIRPLLPNEQQEETVLRVSPSDANVVRLSSNHSHSSCHSSSEERISSASSTKNGNFHSIRQKWQSRGINGKNGTTTESKSDAHSFRFDMVLDDAMNQGDVYRNTGSLIVDEVMKPINNFPNNFAAIQPLHQVLFSFGVSNSGKSYSIMGGKRISRRVSEEYDGIVPRIIDDLFQSFETKGSNELQLVVQISMLEVRNERIYDLLTVPDEGSVQSEKSIRRQATMSNSVCKYRFIFAISHCLYTQ